MADLELFDQVGADYAEIVDQSTALLGRDLDFYTRVKVYQLRVIAKALRRPLTGCSVLDVGCGIGVTDELLMPYVGKLTGVDVSSAMVNEAKQRNPAASYSIYGGTRLPFNDDAFDLAFAICVLHHVDPWQWDAFLAEMVRVVRPGGLAIVIEHNPRNPLTRRAVDRCPFDEDAVLVRPNRIRRGFQDAGGRRSHRRYILFAPFGGDRVRRVERAMGWCPVGAQHAVWTTC